MNVKLLTVTAIAASAVLISACGTPAPANTTTNANKPANSVTTTAPATNAPATNAPATNAPATNAPATNAPAANTAKPMANAADHKDNTSVKDGDMKKDDHAANTAAPAKEGEKKP
jgi:hypothetical protein